MSTNRPIKKLGEIYPEIKIGGTPSREKKEYFGGGLPWVSIRDMGDNKYITETKETLSELGVKNSNVKLIKKGALLFSFKLTVGRMAFAGYDLYTNEAIASFEPNENIDLNYLYYILPYVAQQVDRTNNYGAPLLNKSVIANLKIPFPPLATQQLIVAKLDETFAQIDEAITTTQANIDKTDELTKSVLDKVFEEGEWEKVKLEAIITLNYGKGLDKKDRSESGKYNVYGANGVLAKSDKYLIEGDSIIIGRKGSAGALTRINGKFRPTDVTYYVTLNKKLNMDYIYLALKRLNLESLAQGVKPGINRNDVYDIVVPLPPLAKQQEIVSYLDDVFAQSSQLKEQYQKKLVELKELKASVLQSAFEGKLV